MVFFFFLSFKWFHCTDYENHWIRVYPYIGILCSCLSRYLQHILSEQNNKQNSVLLLFSCSVMSISLWPHGLHHARLPCPSQSPGACSHSCPSSWWCHPTISSSLIPFSSCLQSFPISGSFPVSQLFTSDGQSIGASASASVLPMNIQDWFPLGWTSWILQSKGLLRVFSNTTAQSHQIC